MPNYYNFNELININKVEINPDGWITPIIIEFGIGDNIMYYWRVAGTKHTFSIPLARMNFVSAGNYDKHFKMVLENFKDEYLEWKKQNFDTKWKREYEYEYRQFIL